MAARINIGEPSKDEDGNVRTNDDGDPIHPNWVEVSSVLMNQVSAQAIENGTRPATALAELLAPEEMVVVHQSEVEGSDGD